MKSKLGKRNKRPSILWLLALVVVVGVGAYLYTTYLRKPAATTVEPQLETTTVRRGDITITAVGSGNLVSGQELLLGFRTGGTLTEIAVGVGDAVESGQLLARLDATAARIQVAQAELSLEQAQAKLDTARAEVTQTLAIAELNVGAAQSTYDALLRGEQYTGDRLTSTRVNLEQATEQLAVAQAAYTTAWDPGRDWELSVKSRAAAIENERAAAIRALSKAEDDLQVARAAYNLAVLGLDDDSAIQSAWSKLLVAQQALDAARSGAEVRAAEWGLRQAELSLASAHLALENTELRAPAGGKVIGVSVDVGEAVGTSPIVTLADASVTQVRFYLEEGDLSRIAVGNPVTALFDALPDQPIPGRVTRIDPALVTVNGTPAIQGWAVLDIPELSSPLPIGLTVEVEIVAGKAIKTLLVPVQALRELSAGQYAVFVVNDAGELKLRPVEVGLRDYANAQILSGLEQGEVVSTGTVETDAPAP